MYGYNVIIEKKKLSVNTTFSQTVYENNKDIIYVIQGPKNRINELLKNNTSFIDVNRHFYHHLMKFSAIFLVYDVDHNTNKELENAYQYFNNISDGLLILNVPYLEALAEYNMNRVYKSTNFTDYKKILNQYYNDKFHLNVKEYIMLHFNELLLNHLQRNYELFLKNHTLHDVNDVTMHVQYLLEITNNENIRKGNSKENYEVIIRFYSTVLYVILCYLKGFAKKRNNYYLLLKYLIQEEKNRINQEYMYAKAIVKYHITTVAAFSKFANISVIEAKQYFVIFEQKGIIKKEKIKLELLK